MRQDLGTVWLIVDTTGTVRAAWCCRACAPRGRVTDVACPICGDGPLVAGELAGADALGLADVCRQ